jgi:putative phosphoesterase
MLIGLISDTHQPSDQAALWEEARLAFAGVDLILHAGDIVRPIVLDWLQEIAPVLAARGNNDIEVEDSRIEEMQVLDIEGRRIVMVHDLNQERGHIDQARHGKLAGIRPDVIISGHTHFERIEYRDGVLQINAGSATLPHQMSTRLGTIGLLEIAAGEVSARVLRLGHSEGKRNPGIEYSYTPKAGVVNLG